MRTSTGEPLPTTWPAATKCWNEAGAYANRLRQELEQYKRWEMIVVGEGMWDRFRAIEAKVLDGGPHTDDYNGLLSIAAEALAKRDSGV